MCFTKRCSLNYFKSVKGQTDFFEVNERILFSANGHESVTDKNIKMRSPDSKTHEGLAFKNTIFIKIATKIKTKQVNWGVLEQTK